MRERETIGAFSVLGGLGLLAGAAEERNIGMLFGAIWLFALSVWVYGQVEFWKVATATAAATALVVMIGRAGF